MPDLHYCLSFYLWRIPLHRYSARFSTYLDCVIARSHRSWQVTQYEDEGFLLTRPATAIRRLTLEASQSDIDDDSMSLIDGLRLALLDKKLYIMIAINMCIIGAIGCQNFFPTMTATLGYNHVISLLLIAPPYFFTAIYSCIHSYLSDHSENRFWYMIYPVPIAIAGFVIFMSPATSFGPRYLSMFLMLFIYSINSTATAWIATSISRPPAKRAATYGLVSMLSNTSALWTPYTYRARDSPHFRLALGLVIGMVITAAALSFLLRVILVRENRQLDEMDRQSAVAGGTESEKPERGAFRYTV